MSPANQSQFYILLGHKRFVHMRRVVSGFWICQSCTSSCSCAEGLCSAGAADPAFLFTSCTVGPCQHPVARLHQISARQVQPQKWGKSTCSLNSTLFQHCWPGLSKNMNFMSQNLKKQLQSRMSSVWRAQPSPDCCLISIWTPLAQILLPSSTAPNTCCWGRPQFQKEISTSFCS